MKTAMPTVVWGSTAQLDRETTASNTIVLQPKGCLGGIAVLDFQINLEQALERAALGVVVDMQQVDAVAPEGIAPTGPRAGVSSYTRQVDRL